MGIIHLKTAQTGSSRENWEGTGDAQASLIAASHQERLLGLGTNDCRHSTTLVLKVGSGDPLIIIIKSYNKWEYLQFYKF